MENSWYVTVIIHKHKLGLKLGILEKEKAPQQSIQCNIPVVEVMRHQPFDQSNAECICTGKSRCDPSAPYFHTIMLNINVT